MFDTIERSIHKVMTHPQGRLVTASFLGKPTPTTGMSDAQRDAALFTCFRAVRNDSRTVDVPWQKEWAVKGSQYLIPLAEHNFETIVRTITPEGRQVLILPMAIGSLVLFTFHATTKNLGYCVVNDYENPAGQLCKAPIYGEILRKTAARLKADLTTPPLQPQSNLEDPLMQAERIPADKLLLISLTLGNISLQSPSLPANKLLNVVDGGTVRFIGEFGGKPIFILQPERNGPLVFRGEQSAMELFEIANDCVVGARQFQLILSYYDETFCLDVLDYLPDQKKAPEGLLKAAKYHTLNGISAIADVAANTGILKRW